MVQSIKLNDICFNLKNIKWNKKRNYITIYVMRIIQLTLIFTHTISFTTTIKLVQKTCAVQELKMLLHDNTTTNNTRGKPNMFTNTYL